MENMKVQRAWPQSGYSELQKVVKRFISQTFGYKLIIFMFFSAEPKAQEIISELAMDNFCPSSYLYLVYYMIAHVYVMNPQARVGAVGMLNMDSLAELRSDGMTASSTFKTARLYGTQFVITCQASLRYVSLFMFILLYNYTPSWS